MSRIYTCHTSTTAVFSSRRHDKVLHYLVGSFCSHSFTYHMQKYHVLTFIWVTNSVTLQCQHSVHHVSHGTNARALYVLRIFGDEFCVTQFEIWINTQAFISIHSSQTVFKSCHQKNIMTSLRMTLAGKFWFTSQVTH